MKFKALTGSVLIGGLLSIAVMGLSGCVASANIDPHLTDSASNSRSNPQPSKTAKTPAAPVVKVGETIPPADVAAIQAKSADTGYYPYKLADGSFIMTSNKEATPVAVTQDIARVAAPIVTGYLKSGDTGPTSIATQAFARSKEVELGKRVILVFPGTNLTPSGQQESVWGTLSGSGRTGITIGSKDSVVSAANQMAQSASDPTVVIVIGG